MPPPSDELGETLTADSVSGNAPSAPGIASGEVLAGRYQLVELLGAGGMGTVYRARDLELDEVVALKTLRRELIEAPGALDRFRRELKLARRVTHRSVARAFDLGEHAGERFLTMELVPGPTLGRVLEERGRLDPREAARIAIGITEGLAAAHAAGVVHRDLKPDNVMLDGDRVVITDFGVARAMSTEDVRATAAGGIVGTPAYMAPEQVEGGEVDGRADLYALGALLFEAIAGRLPFVGKTPLAVAAARLVGRAPPLASVAPACPAALAEIVDRALARSPTGRFDSADAMRAALTAALATASPIASHAPDLPARASPERRIAVAPLRASGGGDDDAWIAEGLADDLVDALSLMSGVRVRARAPAPARGEELRDYGRRLDVEVLVEGSVRREGERVRTLLRLMSVEDGFQIWARRFDSSVGELLRVGDDAAHAIAEALAGARLEAPLRPTPVAEAVELYLRAKLSSDSFLTDQAGLLERAVALAPDDPTIMAAYARHAARWAFYGRGDPAQGERALAIARRALGLAPHLPEAHLALANALLAHGDDVGAMDAALLAKRYGPGLGDPDDMIGRLLTERDEVPEAIAHLERALWIDPRLTFAQVDLVRLLAFEQRWDEMNRRVELVRGASVPHHALITTRMRLWGAPIELPELVTITVPVAGPSYTAMRNVVMEGRFGADDQRTLEELGASLPPRSIPLRIIRQLQAELRAYVGDAEGALEAVAAGVDAGIRDLTWMRRCPLLDGARADARFGPLVAVVAARAEPVVARYRAAMPLRA